MSPPPMAPRASLPVSLPAPPFLVITDRNQAVQPLPDLAEHLFALGVRWLSLRDKDLPEPERVALGRALVARARPFSAVVTLHGDAAPALAAGAAGVHLPDGGDVARARALLGSRALIGVSAHDAAGVARASAAGADYATLSPVFASASKPGYGPCLGPGGLRQTAGAAGGGPGLPVVALGGIEDAAAVAACLAAGAGGVAVMGTAMRDPDAVARLLAGFPPAVAGGVRRDDPPG